MASAWRLWALCAALAAAGAAVAAAAGDDDAFARYRAPDPVALLEEEEAHAATAASVFFKGVHRRAAFIPGRLGARFAEIENGTIVGYAWAKKEIYVRKRATARMVAASRLEATATTLRVLHGDPVHNVIRLESNLQIEGDVIFGEHNGGHSPVKGATAFIEELSVVSGEDAPAAAEDEDEQGAAAEPLAGSVGTFRQWKMVAHEDFQDGASGWRWADGSPADGDVDHCGDGSGDMFLHARCPAAAAAGSRRTPTATLVKQYGPLPPHTQLELTARVHFLDAWSGAAAYALVDGGVAWLDSHDHRGDGDDDGDAAPEEEAAEATAKESSWVMPSLCGGATGGDRLSVPVKVVVPHTAPFVEIAFGSTLERSAADACVASLGVDDVSLAVH